jgi:hypothetical protein
MSKRIARITYDLQEDGTTYDIQVEHIRSGILIWDNESKLSELSVGSPPANQLVYEGKKY